MSWAAPLLVLPGVALLVLSTSARYMRAHDELHALAERAGSVSQVILVRLLQRGRLFRNALVALYVAAVLLALAGLAGGAGLSSIAAGLSGGGILALVVGCVLLVREAVLSFHVLEAEGRALSARSVAESEDPGA